MISQGVQGGQGVEDFHVGVAVVGVVGAVVEVPIDVVVRDPGAGRQPWPSDPSTQPGV